MSEPEPVCADGESACAGGCVDTQSNHEHCGGCDNACDEGSVCSLGACSDQCADGLTQCGNDCVDSQSSAVHCGGCDRPCMGPPAYGQPVCLAGQCGITCDEDALSDGITCLGCAAATILEAAPVAYWRLGETSGTSAIDASGSGEHGAYLEVGLGAPGIASDGDTAVVLGTPVTSRVVRDAFGSFPSDAITVALWLRSNDTANAGTLFSYAVGSQFNTVVLYDHRALELYVAGQSVQSGAVLNDGRWHHLALTWESGTGSLQLYVDAVSVFTATLAQGATLAPGGTLVLGQEQDCLAGCFDTTQRFVGELDEVVVFDRVLGETELATHFHTVTCMP